MIQAVLILAITHFLSTGYMQEQWDTVQEFDDSILTCLSQSDAKKILGKPVRLVDSNSEEEGGIDKYRCSYQITSANNNSNLYYMLEVYDDPMAAHEAYAEILSSNINMPGQTTLSGIGDEAWLHNDQKNFHLIVFRKASMMVRIKINKVTHTTSLKNLEEVAREISSKI